MEVMPNPILTSPVVPYQGFRGVDSWGAGGFGAPRFHQDGKEDGGHYAHKGLDFKALLEDTIQAVLDCVVSHNGIAYPNAELGSLHLDGTGDFDGLRVVLLYLKPSVDAHEGAEFKQGDIIGYAQSVAAYWQAQHPERGLMTNHIHEEVYKKEQGIWVLQNPANYLPATGL